MTIIRKSVSQKVSRVVIHNETVYLCGQVAKDVTEDFVGQTKQVAKDVTEDFVGQTKQVLARIDEHLAEAGTDNSKILSALIHIKDTDDVAAFNELWNEWLPEGCAPARSCVQAHMARDVVLVEVTVTAAL